MNVKSLSSMICLMFWAGVVWAETPPDAQSRCLRTGPPPEGGYTPYVGSVSGRAERVIGGVPAYLWRHGCGPTAAGMLIGYWDGRGMDALIPGPAWTQTDEVDQAIASGEQGPIGHYEDYSLPLDDEYTGLLPDMSEPPDGDEHASNCLADFMRTSWSAAGNYYGWSWFNAVDFSLTSYVDYVNATYGEDYNVLVWNEFWASFTWADFVAEIDADRPMVFLVDTGGDGYTDHFVTAIGYRDTYGYQEYACLDTWTTAGYRWERFQGVAAGNRWGIYGVTYFVGDAGECFHGDAPMAEPTVMDMGKGARIRYMSFQANGDAAERVQAVRVTFNDVPAPYAHWNGTRLWVREPEPYCENSGVRKSTNCPAQVGGLPGKTFWGATLGCDPFWTDWTQYEAVHVWNEGIVPAGVYQVQSIDSTCSPDVEGDYSFPLSVAESKWADLVKDCTTFPCGPPDGSTGIVDVTAVLDKFKNLTGNVQKSRADIEPAVPDQLVNITDVTYCLGAYLGVHYPPQGFPAPGDPPVCP